MPDLQLNLDVLQCRVSVKGWSNRPEVPVLGPLRSWSTSPAVSPIHPAIAAMSVGDPALDHSQSTKIELSCPPTTTQWMLWHLITRCCKRLVKSVTQSFRRRREERLAMAPEAESVRVKPVWDGLPSTYYLRLSPPPEGESLRNVNLSPYRWDFASPTPSPLRPELQTQKSKRHAWKVISF